MAKKLPLEGQKFGKWTVISYHSYEPYPKNRGGFHKWNCKCDCGNEYVVREQLFKRGTSSGCKKCANFKLRTTHKKHQIPAKLYSDIKNNDRNLAVNIDDKYLYKLLVEQNFKCALSGVDIKLGETARAETTASVDRIDSSKGYIEGNVQWVHKHVNWMKRDFKEDYFIKLCKEIANYN